MKLNSIYENSLDSKSILNNLKSKVKDGGFINFDPNKGSYLTLTKKEQLVIDIKDFFQNEFSFLLNIYVKYNKEINGSDGTLLQLNAANSKDTFKIISKTVNKNVGVYFGTEQINCVAQHSSIVENRWINFTIIKVGANITLFANGKKIMDTLKVVEWELDVAKIDPFTIIFGGSEGSFSYSDLSVIELNDLVNADTPEHILEVFKTSGKDFVKDVSNRALLNKQYNYQLYNVDNGPKHLEQGKGDVKLDVSSLKPVFMSLSNEVSLELRVKKGVFRLRENVDASMKDFTSFNIDLENSDRDQKSKISISGLYKVQNTASENKVVIRLKNEDLCNFKDQQSLIIPLKDVLELDNLSQQDRVFSELEIIGDGNVDAKIVLFNTTELIDNRGIETSPFELIILNSNELHNHDAEDNQSLLFRLFNTSDIDIQKLNDVVFKIQSFYSKIINWNEAKVKIVQHYSTSEKGATYNIDKLYYDDVKDDFESLIDQEKICVETQFEVYSLEQEGGSLKFKLQDLTLGKGDYVDFKIFNLKTVEASVINPSGEYAFNLLYQAVQGFRDGVLPFKIKTVNVLDNLPIGTILPYTGSKIPRGWLVCDGVSEIKSYRKLHEILGTEKVPNLINRFLYGGEKDKLKTNIEDDIVHIDFADSEKNYEKVDFDHNKNPLQGEPGYGGKERVRLHHKNLPDHDHSYYYNEFMDQYGDIDDRMSINELLLKKACPIEKCKGHILLDGSCSNPRCSTFNPNYSETEVVVQDPKKHPVYSKEFRVNEITRARMNKVVRTTGNTIYSEHHRSHADTDKLLNKSFNIIPPYYRVVYIIKAR